MSLYNNKKKSSKLYNGNIIHAYKRTLFIYLFIMIYLNYHISTILDYHLFNLRVRINKIFATKNSITDSILKPLRFFDISIDDAF